MPASTLLDLYTDDDGDIQVGANGDLLIARDADVIAQELLWRLKTTQGDWMLVPTCGADLEQLIGEPNAPKTGALMEALISRALTYDGFLRGELREVRAVPVNRETLVGLVTVTYGDETFTKTVTLDLKQGIL